MESRSSKWPARFALFISLVMFGAVVGPLSAFGQTTDVPIALQTTSSPSGSGSVSPSRPASGSPSGSASSSPSGSASASGSPSGSASASPSASQSPCRFSPAPPPVCPASPGSPSGSGSPTPSGSSTGGGGETYDSTLTIAYGNDRFSGAVRSDGKCKPGRKVIVRKIRRGPDLLVGRDTTNRRGRWSVGEPDAARGRYYAKVLKRVYTLTDTAITCRGDRSKTIRVS